MNVKVRQSASALSVLIYLNHICEFLCVCVCVIESEVSCLYQGTLYHSNEQWQVDECTSCTCVSGDVHCHSERCPPLTCATVSITHTVLKCSHDALLH